MVLKLPILLSDHMLYSEEKSNSVLFDDFNRNEIPLILTINKEKNADYIPCKRTVFLPVGAFKASWSKVKIVPPAFRMRARAFAVKRSAHT